MLNEHNNWEEERLKLELFIESQVCQRWGLKALEHIRFVKDTNAGGIGSVEPLNNGKFNIRLEPKNILNLGLNFEECLLAIAIHECFHIIFPELNQTNAFKIAELTGDRSEYLRIEQLNWNFVINYFPQFTSTVNSLKLIY